MLKIYHGLDSLDNSPKVVTLGNFDGVHKGHKELIMKTAELGAEKNLPGFVLSFYPHPRTFFNEEIKYINTLDEKNKNLKDLGADALVILEFNKEIAGLTAESFLQEILHRKMNAKIVVVGYDFLFGKNREGNAESLKEKASAFGIDVYIVPPVEVNGVRVSSSLIRECYIAGDVVMAKEFLGYYPTLSGKVVSGKQLGREIGFPTANIDYEKDRLIPGNGVYAVNVFLEDKEYKGIANIGVKPTVKEDSSVEVEVHLIGFMEDLYGKTIALSFLEKIRDEKKFSSLHELKNQIDNDVRRVIKKYCLK